MVHTAGLLRPNGFVNLAAQRTFSKNTVAFCSHTERSWHSAALVGWCIELLQAEFLLVDDVMDGSTTRRGQPCWYLNPDVGLAAINDAMLLEVSHRGAIQLVSSFG